MKIQRTAPPIDIAISGLRAQTQRMNIIAANVANAGTAKTADGTPYRRQEVVLAADPKMLGGVSISEVVGDPSEFKEIYEPGSSLADDSGYVQMPNVDLPVEMMSMMSASRSYQANAAVLKRYQDMGETTLELLK